LSAGSTHYIYVDSAGTIGSTTTRSTSLFQDNIVLFEVLVDSDGTANVIVVKENHSIMTNPETMNSLHELGMHGYDVVEGSGGTITLHGTVGLQVVGTITWHDHDLETEIPDSAAAAVNLYIMYTNGAGKWVRDALQNTVPTEYNNAGTPTALAGNERTIFDILVSKDDIESAVPKYFAVMDDTKYANLSLANKARNNGTFATASNELKALELIRMGTVIINATTIDSVTVNKQTIGTGTITTIGSVASSVDADTSNFDHWLSATDTTVQAALETLDDKYLNVNGVQFTHEGITGSYTDSESISLQAGVQTSDDTLTAIATITLPTNTMCTVQARFNGFISDYSASCGGLLQMYTARRAGAGAVQVSTPNTIIDEDSGTGAPVVSADVNGNDIRLLVTGVAAETYNWTVTYEYNFTKTSA